MDFFTSLSNFGRSLFLVTGPAKDVPAGDVGCGAAEIGQMFEGFKSALRDLALIAYGLKQSVALLGNKIISLREARCLLSEHFNIDSMDSRVLRELATNERYLELVAAPQITGKPRMGIQARTGATGRGLCYSLLATVGKEYLHGRWHPDEDECTDEERAVLSRVSAVTGLAGGNSPEDEVVIAEDDWELLTKQVYPKLLKNKTVVIQGFGKVGSSVMTELAPYGVRCIAVADAGGAIMGDDLDLDEMIQAARENGTIIDCVKGVKERIPGAKEGAMVLELDCDILIPAALENAVTGENAHQVKAKIQVCGSNGPNTSAAEKILFQRGVTVIYDFLANGAGVTASYFEWLRNWTERYRYEAEEILGENFDIDVMEPYLMPEFKNRLKEILLKKESPRVTLEWNALLRDIMFTSVNEDYDAARSQGISMKTAGFINTQLRVLTAVLLKAPQDERKTLWKGLPQTVKERLRPFFEHPEAGLLSPERDGVLEELFD
jgi:glutamate dehydrogenase/leucine dehydrogenase